MNEATRRTWIDPEILIFGNVHDLTLARNKNYRTGDAFTFENETTKLSM